MNDRRYDGLHELVAVRGDALLRTAILLAGSRDGGEDLFQHGLERLTRHWGHVEGDPEAYLRRTLSRLAIDRWRHRARSRERLGEVPSIGESDRTATVDLRDVLVRALAQLPARQRTVLVLRYWEQLTEAETAATLGCSIGTVKSASSRGLSRLRHLVPPEDNSANELSEGAHR